MSGNQVDIGDNDWVDLGAIGKSLAFDPRDGADCAASFSEIEAPMLSRSQSVSEFSEFTSELNVMDLSAWRARYGGLAVCVGPSAWSQKRWLDARYGSECWCEFYTGAKCVHCTCGYTYAEAEPIMECDESTDGEVECATSAEIAFGVSN